MIIEIEKSRMNEIKLQFRFEEQFIGIEFLGTTEKSMGRMVFDLELIEFSSNSWYTDTIPVIT